MYDNIRQQDPAVYDAMMRELQRQRAYRIGELCFSRRDGGHGQPSYE